MERRLQVDNKQMDNKSLDEILCFLIISARGCLDEPQIYGPLRLLDAYCRIVETMASNNLNEFWKELKDKVESFKYLAMADEDGFKAHLDQAIVEVAKFINGSVDNS